MSTHHDQSLLAFILLLLPETGVQKIWAQDIPREGDRLGRPFELTEDPPGCLSVNNIMNELT